MKIGNVDIKNRLVLAPMAGVTDPPYRHLCKKEGAGLVYTEMISATALFYKNKATQAMLITDENDGPLAVQLFGNDPDIMAEEALKLEGGPFDIFDINMGCPVPKVVKNNEGSALMQNPHLVERIITAMVKTLKKPVTVKIRKGFDENSVNAAEIARIAEGSGASAIAIHGRTRKEMYSGHADWNIIRQVKESVNIPVLGSGDIFSACDVKKMIDETGVDFVMAARGARGNPWIFSQAEEYLKTGILPEKPDIKTVANKIIEHFKLLEEYLFLSYIGAGHYDSIHGVKSGLQPYEAAGAGGGFPVCRENPAPPLSSAGDAYMHMKEKSGISQSMENPASQLSGAETAYMRKKEKSGISQSMENPVSQLSGADDAYMHMKEKSGILQNKENPASSFGGADDAYMHKKDMYRISLCGDIHMGNDYNTELTGMRRNIIETQAVHRMRTHVCWYSQGYENSSALRRDINLAETKNEFIDILSRFAGL